MAKINLDGFGYNEYEEVTTNKTLDAGDSGVVQDVTAACTVTLPAAAAGASGLVFWIRVGAPDITVTVSPNSGDKIVGNGFTAADDKDAIATNQPVGSLLALQSVNEATTDSCYTVVRVLGTWTRQA